MTREDLVERLHALAVMEDREAAHAQADDLLLTFIGDNEVREAFNSQEMWYG